MAAWYKKLPWCQILKGWRPLVVWCSVTMFQLHMFPSLCIPFPSLIGFQPQRSTRNPGFCLCLLTWEEFDFFAQGSPLPVPPRSDIFHPVFRTKAWRTSASKIVRRNIISRSWQMSPERWSQRNQTGPSKYQAATPISFDLSWEWRALEILGQLSLLFPCSQDLPALRTSSPVVLLGVPLACWYEIEGDFNRGQQASGLYLESFA